VLLYGQALDVCSRAKRKEKRKENFKWVLNWTGGSILAGLIFYLLFLQGLAPCDSTLATTTIQDLRPCLKQRLAARSDRWVSCGNEGAEEHGLDSIGRKLFPRSLKSL